MDDTGRTATPLVAVALLGTRCAYASVLGTDQDSDLVLAHFIREGVDVSQTRRRAGVGPIRSTAVIGREDATRTVFSDRNGFTGPDLGRPPGPDQFGPGRVRRSRRRRGDGPGRPSRGHPDRRRLRAGPGEGFPELLGLADHPIPGREFATRLTGAADPAAAPAPWGGPIACDGTSRCPGAVASAARRLAQGCWVAPEPTFSADRRWVYAPRFVDGRVRVVGFAVPSLEAAPSCAAVPP